MTIVAKIDSNNTGLSYAEELSLGVLPVTPTWIILEPNSYSDFGGEITTVARAPINPSRQRQKGVVTDLDASGGFNSDLTQKNMEDILQGFFFADLRPKGEESATSVVATGELYNMADTTGIFVGSLVFASGFVETNNNGLKNVDVVTASTSISVTQTLTDEGSPPTTNNVVVVGNEGTAGDIDVDATGSLPALTSTTLDFTTLGLIPGETIFIGGDSASNRFVAAANNGFARIFSITANRLTLDKTQDTMVTEASTTETIQLFFGRVLKNESDPTLINRRSYNLERTLGAPDDALPAEIQSEYLVGAVPNEFTFNLNTADKVTSDLTFVATDNEQRTGATGVKAGNRPALVLEDAFNTSSDFTRLKLAILDPTNSNPTALFGFLTEFTVAINNNVTPNKAVSVLGAFEATAGNFEVGGSITAYFSQVTAVQAVRNNSDVTLDFSIVRARTVDTSVIRSGVNVDVPLIGLGGGRITVEQDEPILIPLESPAAADRNFNHTLMMVFYDFLPDVADT